MAITPKTRLICIANPNNPTGAIATREQLLAIVHAAPQAAVLIDEAYIHFGGESLLDQLGRSTISSSAAPFPKPTDSPASASARCWVRQRR